jgi:hypothetical protein
MGETRHLFEHWTIPKPDNFLQDWSRCQMAPTSLDCFVYKKLNDFLLYKIV